MRSKIVFFSLLLVFLSINISCGDKFSNKLGGDHLIPYTPVYTEIVLNSGGEAPWNNGAKYFSTSAPNPGSLGYKGHGIVVCTTNGEDFTCFDATCTHCADLESYFTDRDLTGWTATCPNCGTEYELIGGQATNVAEKTYPLKPYPIIKRNNKLIVSYQ